MAQIAVGEGSRGSSTLALVETPSSSQPTQQVLTLRLARRPRKKVTWKEGTVDNEFMNKKSSKKCCIFHREKPFDEDNSDDDCDEKRRKERDNSMSCDRGQSSGGNSCLHQH
ncbi:hypothetical protein SUGI_1131490 [Cryptomeria japonica]|nr:hypothetical protein SUGI_1131490 [Cryptomeria japonica]